MKPGNIFIRHDPRSGTIHPILADFGIGCILRPELLDEEGYTRAGFTHPNTLGPGSRTGTSMYAPPEYEKMRAKASPKGDVYSIGVLLYQMLIGDFTQPWESAQECERRIPDSPALHAPDCHLNPFIRKAILKALDAEDHRFASADELALKLTELQRDYEEDEATKAQQKNQRLRKLLSLSAAAVIVLTGLAFWAMRSENRAVDAESQQRASASALKIQRDANEKLVDDRGLALRQKTQGTGFNAPPSDMKLLLPHVLEASRAVQVTDLQQRRIQAQRLMRLCEWLGDSIEAVSQYDSALLQLATFHRDSPEDDVMRVAYLDALFFSRRWAHTWIEKAVSSKVGDAWVADNAELVKMCRLRITTWSDDAIKVTTEASSSKPDSYVVLHEAFAYLSKVLLLKAAERVPAIRSSATSPSGDIPIPTLPNLGENLKAFAEKWLLAQSHTTSMPWESLPQAQIDIPGHTTPVTMSWQFISKNTLSLTMLHWSVIGLDDAYTRDVASAELGLAVIKTCRQRASVAVTEGDGTYAEELFGKIQAYLAVAAPMTDQNRLHHEMAQFYHQLGHYQESRRSEAAIESYSHNLDAWKWLNTKHPEESKYKLEMVATLRHRVNALLTIGLDSPEWDEKARTWCNEALILFDTLPPDVQKSSQGELRSVLGLRATFGKDAQDKLSYLNRSVGVARVALDNTGRLGANNQEALMDLAFSLQQAAAQLIQDGGDLKNAQLQAQEAIKLLTEEVMIPQPSQKANLLMVRLHNVIGRVAAERHDSELRGEEFSAAYAAAAKLDLSELSNRFVYFEASLSLGSHLMEVQRYGEAMKALSPAINQALALSKTSPGLHPAELSIVSRLCGLMIKAHYWTAEPGVHETVLGAAGATQRILHQPWLMGSLNKDQKEILHTALSIIAVRGLSLIDSSASQKDGGVPIPEIVNNHFAESKLALKELGNPPTFSSWETYLSYRIADFIDSRWDDKSKEECQAAFNEFLSQVRERASMQPLAIRSAIIALCDLSTAHARMEHWSDAHSMYQAAERMLDDPIYKMAKDKHCLLALAQIAGAMHELTNRKGLTEPSLFWHSELLRLKERMAIELTETHTAQGDAFSDFIQNLTTTREINRVFRALVESQKRGIPAVLYDRETPRGAKMAGPDADGRTMTQELFLQRGSLTSALLPDDPAPTRESEIRNIKKAESEIHATKKPRTDAPLEKQSRLLISALDNAAFQCLAGGKMSDAEKWARQSLALDTEGFAATAHLVCSLLFQDKDVEAFNLCSDQLLRSTKSSWLAETVLDDLTILRIHGRQHAKERLLVKVIYEHAAPALLRLRLDKLKLAEIAHEKTPSQQTSADLGSALSSLSDCEVYVKRWGDAESHARKAVQMNPYREYAHANLATSLLLQGKYEEALFIYQTHWLEPTSGWTLGDSILLDFERLEAIGITHPELARVKEDMAKLAEKDKQPAKAKDPPFNPIKP
ncbi:MAG: hypothetical protein NTY98_04950 [Verrucomicrobia bacterium]|nr:hypothetical protein [Verrucomicrobiota bacterium]